MKKILLLLLNFLILSGVGIIVYNSYLEKLNSDLTAECSYQYEVINNLMSLTCDIKDEDLIISDSHPVTFTLYSSSGTELLTEVFIKGINDIEIDSLEYNSEFVISITGYKFISDKFVKTTLYEHEFSTARESINIPTWVFTESLLLDTEYNFSFEVFDSDDCIESIDITIYDNLNEEILTQSFEDNDILDLSLEDLSADSSYYLDIQINYVINDYNEITSILINKTFTTLDLILEPSAEILNVLNNSVNLTFDLVTENRDGSSVVYTVQLIDLSNNILISQVVFSSSISIDVSTISGDYYISIKASYMFLSSAYTDIELDTFNIYENALSNNFLIPGLNIMNTDLPLTSYDDYDDYVYTYFNQGITDFTIYCEAPVDCTELILSATYENIPHRISDLVHAYFDVTTISYSYNSSELEFAVEVEYETSDIILIEQYVNTILNDIINETMTEYDKILAVHDYVVNNANYDTECSDNISLCDTDHIAIGIFVDELAVCEGYAHAIDIMLRALNIPTFKVSSTTHQWNAVQYEGTWYHLDATWDDPVGTGSDILSHDFFLVTSTELDILDDTESHTYSTSIINFID